MGDRARIRGLHEYMRGEGGSGFKEKRNEGTGALKR